MPWRSLLVLALSSAPTAQSIVLPARANTQAGTLWVSPTIVIYGNSASHTLQLYSTGDSPTVAAAVTSLALRRTTAIRSVMPATTANLKIVMSMSPLASTPRRKPSAAKKRFNWPVRRTKSSPRRASWSSA